MRPGKCLRVTKGPEPLMSRAGEIARKALGHLVQSDDSADDGRASLSLLILLCLCHLCQGQSPSCQKKQNKHGDEELETKNMRKERMSH